MNFLIERTLKGGLKQSTQRYRLRYMPKEGEYCSKIIVEHKIDEIEKRFWSLRFSTPEQLLDFIGHCLQAYIFFERNDGKFLFDKMNDTLKYYIKKGVENED